MGYITPKVFKDFCTNQEKLVEILNHRMTNVELNMQKMLNQMISIKTDVSWTKKILWAIFGVAIVSLMAIIIKTAFGI